MTDTVIFSSFTPLNADKSNPDPHFPREPFSMLDFRLYHDLRLQSPRILCQQWLACSTPYTPSILVGLFLSLLAIFSSSLVEQKSSKHCGNLIDPRSLLELFPHRIRISNSNILDWVVKKSPDICKKSIRKDGD